MSELAARARGLSSRLATPEALAVLDTVHDRSGLAAACAAIGLPGEQGADELVLRRTTTELAILERWASGELRPLILDEDRRTLRAIVRGIVANVSARTRIAGAIATSSLPRRLIERLGTAPSLSGLPAVLGDHPFAAAITSDDPLEVELALARSYFALVRDTRGAMRVHVAQLIDVENAMTALLLAERGGEISPESCFIAGGMRTRLRMDRDELARAFAGTPIAPALYSASPAAVEEAALAWHLATQARLRRAEPESLAPAIYFVLRRRAEARRIRGAAWRIALGGAP